jgi:TRAP-type uncharacterized transport system substrate-binding protein
VRPTSLASGAAGGVYQPIAEAIARESPGLMLPLTVESTGASVANMQLLTEGKVQLALVQNDIAYYAAQGTTLAPFRGRARGPSGHPVDLSGVHPRRGNAGLGRVLGRGVPG